MSLVLLGPRMTIDGTGEYNTLRQVGYALVLILSLATLEPWRQPQRLLVVPWPILAALAWCWLSVFWMLDPSIGVRRLVLTTIVAWTVFALVRQLGPERFVAVLRIILAVALGVNFVFAVFYPAIGRHPLEGDIIVGSWRGLMGHKNFAGVPCAMAILFFIFDTARVHVILRVLVCVGAAVFLAMAESKTSMGICAVAVGVGLLLQLLATHFKQRQLAPPWAAWIVLAVLALIALTMAYNPAYYLDLVSDPAAFTGRTQIWAAMIKSYVDAPWLGVGFGSYWDLGPGGPIFKYGADWVTQMSEGHNAYLDFLVQIGFVGTMILLFALIVWPLQRLLYGGEHPARPLSGAIIVFCLGHSFTESQLFDRDSLVQVMMMVALALLWSVTAAPVKGAKASVPGREPRQPAPTRAPLRL